MRPWERVCAFCHRVGVEFRIVPGTVARQSPFSQWIGISWTDRVLYVSRKRLRDPTTVGNMIHEIGHIVATRVRPSDVEEVNFTAWEWRAALVCGVERQWWRYAMELYGTGDGRDFGELSTTEQRAFLRGRMKVGRALGNVSPSGRPVSLR